MELDMTKGNPSKIIIKFFIPLFIGDLLQQFYGIIDAIVIGKFVGTDAFAAVGSSGAVIMFITSILIGLAMGASAIFSQLYGGRQYDELKQAISTALIFLFCISVMITIATSVFLPQIISLYQMPEETAAYAADYLKYVFYGFVFVGMYNAFAFLLRAFGDSKTPLYFLIISCISNLILDLLFIVVLHMGTAGAAIATLLTQAFAAVGCGIYTIKRMKFLNFERKDFKFSISVFNKIATFSVLTALQQSISSFGMMLIQGLVNTFGSTVMAAFAACSKIDSVANAPLQDLGNSFSTYTAQNEGAGEIKRIREGFRTTSRIIIILSAVISVVAFIFAPNLITLFVNKDATEVIAVGVGYLRIVSVFYVLLGFIVMFYGFFRGLGAIKISILMTIVSQGLRVLLAYSFAPVRGFSGICWAIVVGWFLSDLLGFYMYKKVMSQKAASFNQ
ncbi:MATE family efflux transporter [Lacrimispora sp.]|jgi:putative MATE family efflux protein|uniref:MATE family efflux transporter n=1 Tax=Lacrimispora sp. TaxID=2719234 RepID=UPI002897A6AC|nr:MATE family efflux transporter [Lacrimispora sp.]